VEHELYGQEAWGGKTEKERKESKLIKSEKRGNLNFKGPPQVRENPGKGEGKTRLLEEGRRTEGVGSAPMGREEKRGPRLTRDVEGKKKQACLKKSQLYADARPQ